MNSIASPPVSHRRQLKTFFWMDTKPVISAALRAWANELGASPAQLAPVRPEHAHYRNRAGLLDALISELRHRIALSKRELYPRHRLTLFLDFDPAALTRSPGLFRGWDCLPVAGPSHWR